MGIPMTVLAKISAAVVAASSEVFTNLTIPALPRPPYVISCLTRGASLISLRNIFGGLMQHSLNPLYGLQHQSS